MGGIIIILSILVPCLLVGNLSNVYMLLMIVSTLWLGTLGFLDDYIKVARHNKDGLNGKFKIVGQVGLGLIVGLTMWLNPSITIRENVETVNAENGQVAITYVAENVKSTQTTIPFVKNNNFDYQYLTEWMGDNAETGAWILFIIVTIFVVTATSNGANLTDGLDGLCAGTSAIICVALAIMAYLGGNIIYSHYLNIMYIPGSGNAEKHSKIFMGDTGSLTIGGIIAVFALLIHKELLIPILCAIFFVEDLSVMLQVAYFKYTKKRTGTGRRVFKMTPLHHHYQKPGNSGIDALIQYPLAAIPESKIVTRFWIVGIFLAVITFVTLKIR